MNMEQIRFEPRQLLGQFGGVTECRECWPGEMNRGRVPPWSILRRKFVLNAENIDLNVVVFP
jgi:hypothetical protein